MRTTLAATVALLSCRSDAPPPVARPALAPAAVVAPAPAPAPPAEAPPLGPLPADVHPLREALALDIDPAAARFGGTAELELQLDRPRTVIWLHGRGLAVTAIDIALPSGERRAARWDEVDPSGVARVTLTAPLAGRATLHVAYSAAYDPQLVGVYRTAAGGGSVFSKFEAIYARRAFPCFDEPAFKIPFDVALVVPRAAVAVGNMPIAESTPVAGDRQRVRFATTPPLPTYLVAFAVGPFEARATEVPPTALRPQPLPVGGVALAGRAKDTRYALDEERAIIAEQERYFGMAFPYPKLDLIAVPDFQSGAMENAGAITFRDSLLLVDDAVTSLGQRISVTSVVAHETAHQWFGDLVTMKWWDDLWLNEGFATFLATRTLRAVRPGFEAELEAVEGANGVMSQDSLASARRIRQPIESTHDITNAFDGITYQKGAAVLAMLEHYVGDEAFRAGVHAFLAAHARGNATTDDLVAALSAAAGRPLGPLAASFLDQPGVPVVAARPVCEAGAGRVDLAQSRWRAAGSTLAGDPTWSIPVCVRAGIGPRVVEACTLLAARTGSLALPGCADWVMPNAQAAGYYRFTLPAADLARLRDRGARHLATAERLALALDLEAAFRSVDLPGGDVLGALDALARDPHGAVAAVPLDLYGFVDQYVLAGPAHAALRAALRRHVAAVYAPAVRALRWQAAPADTTATRLFRVRLLSALALDFEDPATLDAAARMGRAELGLGRGRAAPLDPDLARLVLAAAARRGDAAVFDALVARLAASDDAQVRGRVLGALASARDPVLVGRALDLSLDPRLRQNERLGTLGALLGAPQTRDAAWAWLVAHFDALVPMLPDRFGGYLPFLLGLCDAQHAAEARAFLAPRVEQLTGGPRNLAQALEGSEQCAARVAAQQASVVSFARALR